MVDIVVSVAAKVAEYMVAPIRRQCGYVIFTNSYVGRLEEELEKLNRARCRVQRFVNKDLLDGKQIKWDVEEWLKKVETVTNKASYDGRAEKTCFYGWLPNPKERYHLGRDARKTIPDIESLIQQGNNFTNFSDEGPPPGQVIGTPDVNSSISDGGDTITESRVHIFQDIMEALADEKVQVIGVYGLGGVGKTTLLEEVEKKLKKAGRPFHMIVKAKVSQNYVSENIRNKIADDLKLDLKDLQSEEGRANCLLQRLQRDPSEKVLIILDDLWEELDLKAIGIPSRDVSGKCKFLLTSRYKHVLEQRMHADRTFQLQGLNEDEAFRLFEKMVDDKLNDEDLKAIAVKVVKKLEGLPLLINSVASTLKYSGAHAWRNALIKIGELDIIENIVKLSYDQLESKDAKSLFLLCGLIGGTIKVETLLVLGMGLDLFEGFNETMQDARDRLNTVLESLHSICLLQNGDGDKKNVTIHDLYSGVVISTSFKGQNSLMMNNSNGSWPKEKIEKCWAICLTNIGGDNTGGDRLAEVMGWQFPYLKILMLSSSTDWQHQHDMGDCSGLLNFTYMEELRVLYLSFMRFTSLPSSIGILGNLHSLYLSNCVGEDVKILGKLKALQILSFQGSNISRLPKEIGELKNLRSLNLSKCHRLKKVQPGALKGLIKLEELYMKKSFNGWMGEDETPSEFCNARLAELKSLTKLTTLEISIVDPTLLFKDGDLPFGNLIRFWIKIGKVEGREFKGLTTMKLNLEGCNSILSREWVQKILEKTQYLHLEGLRGSEYNVHELCTQRFRLLKHLHILDSPSIKYIVNSSKDIPLTTFPILESLFLQNLINLEKICHGPVVPECFSKLRAVTVKKCDRLKNLWFLSEIQRLEQLEELEIRECDSMRAIVTDDTRKDIVAADNRVELPKVCRLELVGLPNMTSFCTGAGIQSEDAPIQVSLPRLESLKMCGLLGLEKILYSDPSKKYSSLKSIEIKKSQSVSSILKSDWILKLPNLESLDIQYCQSVEVVFDMEELKVTGDVEILSRLTKLTLWELPDLQRMWKHDVQLQGISVFRNLKELNVVNTGRTFLFPVSVAKCLREIRSIRVAGCPNMKSLILDEEGRDEGTNDIMEFPLLERLSICECPMEKFFSCPNAKKESVATTSNSQDAYSDSFFDQKVSLPRLKSLEMYGVLGLEKICDNMVFRNLKKLSVGNTGLTFLFPVSVAKCLREIRSITVARCPNMKALILDEEGRDEGTNDIMEFPLLERLYIEKCPMEKFFSCPNTKKESVATTSNSQDAYSDSFFDQKVTFPDITTLCIEGVRCKELWNNDIPVDSFCQLKSLELKHCDNLLSVAPSHMWKRLEHSLEILEVESCRSIEIIYDGDGTVTKNGKLRTLELRDLANLRHIWQSDGLPNVPFPNLRCVEAARCSGLKMLFATFTAEFLGQIEELVVESCENMELIAGDEECEEAIGRTITFSKLTALRLFKLPKFRSFLPEKYSLKFPYSEDFPSLRDLSIVSCGTEEDRSNVDWESHRVERLVHRAERRAQILCRQIRDQRIGFADEAKEESTETV